MPNCRVCKTSLTIYNWYSSYRRCQSNICIECTKNKMYIYRKKKRNDPEWFKKRTERYHRYWIKNKDRWKSYAKEYRRKHIVYVNGKAVLVNKRSRPEVCELCEKQRKRLDYHHWDDNNPSKGVWVCNLCHIIVEALDKNTLFKIISKYKRLYTVINQSIIL